MIVIHWYNLHASLFPFPSSFSSLASDPPLILQHLFSYCFPSDPPALIFPAHQIPPLLHPRLYSSSISSCSSSYTRLYSSSSSSSSLSPLFPLLPVLHVMCCPSSSCLRDTAETHCCKALIPSTTHLATIDSVQISLLKNFKTF